MIRLSYDMSIADFEGWSGAENTLDKIIEHDKIDELENYINETYEEGIGQTELNDLLRFEDDFLYEILEIEI